MNKKLILLLGAVALLVGCQAMPYKPYARKVKVKPRKGGIVALKVDHNDQDRAYAEKIMTKSCYGKGFDVLEEGEVVIGTQTSSTATKKEAEKGKRVGSLWGIPLSTADKDQTTNTSSTTVQKKEWQINYKCLRIAKSKPRKKTIR